jgi:DNA polymerase III delta subunit
MLIFLYGPDDYRRHKEKKEIVARSEKNHGGAKPSVFNMENEDAIGNFNAFIRNQPIFETSKSAILENAYAVDPVAFAKLLKPIATDKNTNVLLSERKKPAGGLGFLLKNPVRVLEFENLTGSEWVAFVKEEAKALGVALDDAAARFLGNVYEGDSWALVTELRKLASFKPSITRKDLNSFDLSIAPDYWPLLNGMKSHDMRNRMMALEKLFSINDPAAKTFNMLASQWREKTAQMAEYDFAVKSGKLNYEEVLLALALG